ncbi:hypothetical protein CMV_018595 [Castanea mollissima]|uniref:Uncharacterized protein n=1 Tax=Castanea mollissima TaxID=60419 RepID=A0A8J4VCF4_9ROSI|nr:hypothetical protein CMV_018595 [Castanea mollissima]
MLAAGSLSMNGSHRRVLIFFLHYLKCWFWKSLILINAFKSGRMFYKELINHGDHDSIVKYEQAGLGAMQRFVLKIMGSLALADNFCYVKIGVLFQIWCKEGAGQTYVIEVQGPLFQRCDRKVHTSISDNKLTQSHLEKQNTVA